VIKHPTAWGKIPNTVKLFFRLTLSSLLLTACVGGQTKVSTNVDLAAYEERAVHDPDGIGRFYLGREIAHVMGHEGAEWLERANRADTELPDQVVKQMQLRAADVVGDIGAGTGYFTFRLSPLVPRGRVYAVDIQPEMLAMISQRKQLLKVENVVPVKGTESDVNLPIGEVDVVLMVDAYHEFSWPREMMTSITKCLKPGGRVVLVEYRGEDPDVPIKRLHKMTVAQARKEMGAAGLAWKQTKDFLPYQHFIVFEKPLR
jgi:ubiquinone/menaquinone biosynthesis C-methylase UbiE